MADQATLLADLEKLKAARRSGTRLVRFEGHHVEYRTDKELVAAIVALEDEIRGGAGPRNVVVRSVKGWT